MDVGVIRKLDPLKKGSLDTLAQLGTSCVSHAKKDDKLSMIPCTHEDDKSTLKKRAYRKLISSYLSLRLVDASRINPKSSLQKAYYNTYHCCSTIAIHASGKVIGSYCKNRWCLVCNSIRTAVLINNYMPIIEDWNDKHFVTLTLKNCKGDVLRPTIDGMQKVFVKVKATIRKRYQRGKGDAFIGLRKLECTYNPVSDEYHPHFHFIINGSDNASELYYRWIDLVPGVNPDAQDIREADDNSVRELFKYFTKLVSKVKDNDGQVIDKKVYADAMDVIFNSIKGLRTFQYFGFKMKKVADSEDFEGLKNSSDPVISYAKWFRDMSDWMEDNGDLLSGYIPSDDTLKLVKKDLIVRSNYHTKQTLLFKDNDRPI